MTDKERLEEIKSVSEFQLDNDSHYGRPANVILNGDDVKWLIKQAERVQELEDIIYQDARQEVLEGLYEENKRYRETLEFYADRENFKPKHFDPETVEYTSTIDHDEGQTARKALEGEGE